MSQRDPGGQPDAAGPEVLIAELAEALRHLTVDFEPTVRQMMEGGPTTPRERALLESLRLALDPAQWENLPALLIEAKPVAEARREAEARSRHERQQAARDRQAAREIALASLDGLLERDFLSVDDAYRREFADVLSVRDFEAMKASFVGDWVTCRTGNAPDVAQCAAVGSVQGHTRVIARAGSGKTSVAVARAVFLIEHCGIHPDEIMLLAFNRKAADEVDHRISGLLGKLPAEGIGFVGDGPHVATFHSLAYAIVQPIEDLVYDDPADPDPAQSRFTQQVLKHHMAEPDFFDQVRRVMLAYFREDWHRLHSHEIGATSAQGLASRRGLVGESLQGDRVKSFGEKVIANFLFEHDLPYRYEQARSWGGRPYRPDFTIKASSRDVIIEYWGLEGNPAYDAVTAQKKEYWKAHPGYPCVSVYPSDVAGKSPGEIDRLLTDRLSEYLGVPPRLAEEEIWARCADRGVLTFTNSLTRFIGRCRQLTLTPDSLHEAIQAKGLDLAPEAGYLRLAEQVYAGYLDTLKAEGIEDFNGLMQRAAHLVETGTTRFNRRGRRGDISALKYVMVDEFQDYSTQFHRLMRAMRDANPGLRLFTVGDDWQAINGFAGSDLTYFTGHGDYTTGWNTVVLTNNYRSQAAVVHSGNAIMAGQGAPGTPTRSGTIPVNLLDLDELAPTAAEMEGMGQARIDSGNQVRAIGALRLIARALSEHEHVHVLSRTDAGQLEKAIRATFDASARDRISVSTVHKYKGRESPCVIIVDAEERRYPLVHPHWVFERVFGVDQASIIKAETRLFYVAVTRAADELFVMRHASSASPFLVAWAIPKPLATSPFNSPALAPRTPPMSQIPADPNARWRSISWVDVPPASLLPQDAISLVVHRGYEIRDQLKAARFRFNDRSRTWYRTAKLIHHDLERVAAEPWSRSASNLRVDVASSTETRTYWVNAGDWTPVYPAREHKGRSGGPS